MEWTDEMPTKAGLYYIKTTSNEVFTVAVRIMETPAETHVGYSFNANLPGDSSDWLYANNFTGMWAGPLPSPPKVST